MLSYTQTRAHNISPGNLFSCSSTYSPPTPLNEATDTKEASAQEWDAKHPTKCLFNENLQGGQSCSQQAQHTAGQQGTSEESTSQSTRASNTSEVTLHFSPSFLDSYQLSTVLSTMSDLAETSHFQAHHQKCGILPVTCGNPHGCLNWTSTALLLCRFWDFHLQPSARGCKPWINT